nr:MAG TPA: hypothetical protein [Caudoviricetes sp.]
MTKKRMTSNAGFRDYVSTDFNNDGSIFYR